METTLIFKEYNTCRVCGADALRKIINLGNQRVVDFPFRPGITSKPIIPLVLMFCEKCFLVQLSHTTNPNLLFNDFWYRSGINESMKAALNDVVINSTKKINLRPGDMICDIGANDGTMLAMYPKDFITVGFDPSNQIDTDEARSRMTYAIRNYFNIDDVQKIFSKERKRFKIITAIAMFYDLDDPATFLMQLKLALEDDGVIIIQMNYLLSMLKNTAFDNISHEHITYFSVTTLRYLLKYCGLEIVDVETNNVNGGSFRVYIKKTPVHKADLSSGAYERIKLLIEEEKEYGLQLTQTYYDFGNRINSMMDLLQKYIVKLTSIKKIPIYAYGASTRGTTLLQTTTLPLAGVADRDENKWSRYMISGWLKIFPEDYVRTRCKNMLVLPWHFLDGILEREKEWMEQGGKLIVPLPIPTVHSREAGTWLKEPITQLMIDSIQPNSKGEQNASIHATNVES